MSDPFWTATVRAVESKDTGRKVAPKVHGIIREDSPVTGTPTPRADQGEGTSGAAPERVKAAPSSPSDGSTPPPSTPSEQGIEERGAEQGTSASGSDSAEGTSAGVVVAGVEGEVGVPGEASARPTPTPTPVGGPGKLPAGFGGGRISKKTPNPSDPPKPKPLFGISKLQRALEDAYAGQPIKQNRTLRKGPDGHLYGKDRMGRTIRVKLKPGLNYDKVLERRAQGHFKHRLDAIKNLLREMGVEHNMMVMVLRDILERYNRELKETGRDGTKSYVRDRGAKRGTLSIGGLRPPGSGIGRLPGDPGVAHRGGDAGGGTAGTAGLPDAGRAEGGTEG